MCKAEGVLNRSNEQGRLLSGRVFQEPDHFTGKQFGRRQHGTVLSAAQDYHLAIGQMAAKCLGRLTEKDRAMLAEQEH